MSLTGRFSALFLATIGLALAIFSTSMFVAASVYLDRRVRERLDAALAILAAAAEIHPEGVEWEPGERALELGQEPEPDRLRWLVLDDEGRVVDRSPNLDDVDGLGEAVTRPEVSNRDRLTDRQGGHWRVGRRVLLPVHAPAPRPAEDPGPGDRFVDPTRFPAHLDLIACAPLGPTEATLATLGWLLIAMSAGIWLASAALCRGLSRRALRPLARLVESARGLDATDPGWSLAEAGTGDELDDLGRAFNDLLGRLHVAYERQRRFSGDASHQLRTPLTVLIGQLQVALRHDRTGEEYRRALTSALGRAEQLTGIVEALLFLSRAESEAGLPGVESIELHGWTAEHLLNRPNAGAEPPLHREEGSEPLWIKAHPALLGQLLDNLLDNAIKYGQGSAVIVETRRHGDSAILSVEDRGPGIAPEDLPRIFEPFYRSATARRRGVNGVGLGLAIVRRIATVCGGAVTAESVPGQGTRFEARFPTIPAPVDANEASTPIDHRPTAGVESLG